MSVTSPPTHQIQQVLLNLAVNAHDAMPEGGELSIAVSKVDIDRQFLGMTPHVEPGDYVLFEMEDTGTGMPEEVRERVFEPFFTTKPQGVGTGLGLSTSAAILRSHGGFARVYSEVGRFCVYVPASSGDAIPVSVSGPETDLPRGHNETVLVVDDEAAIRAMTRQTLEAYGYRVLEAANGAEAISVFARHQAEVAVVLTDMMMPVLDGPATILALRNLDPAVRIVGASGLQGSGKAAQAANEGLRHFLPKPYTSRSLLRMIAEVLQAD